LSVADKTGTKLTFVSPSTKIPVNFLAMRGLKRLGSAKIRLEFTYYIFLAK